MTKYFPVIRENTGEYQIITDISSVSVYPPASSDNLLVDIDFTLPDYCRNYVKNASQLKFWDSRRNIWSDRGCDVNVDVFISISYANLF